MATLLRTIRTVGYKIGLSGISFFIGWVTVRYLSVAERGIYTSVTITLLLGTYCVAGYGNFFNYGLNRLKLDRQAVVGVASRFMLQILDVNVILLVANLLLSIRYPWLSNLSFTLATMIFVIGFGYASRLLQALNQIDWLNRLNSLQSLIFLVIAAALLIIYTVTPATIRPHALTFTLWGWLLSNAVATIAALIVTHRLAKVSFRPLRDNAIRRQMLSYGHRIAAQNLLAQLNYRGDAYAVLFFLGNTALGLYGIAVSSSEILWQVSSSISLIVYARIATEERSGSIALTERSIRFTVWILILGAAFMLLAFAPLMHSFYPRYDRSVAPFRILILGTMMFGAVGLFTQFFTDQLGKVQYAMGMQAMSVVVNVTTCIILIPRIGIMGGAIGSTTAYAAALILSILYYRKHTDRPLRYLILPTEEDRHLIRHLLPMRRRPYQL